MNNTIFDYETPIRTFIATIRNNDAGVDFFTNKTLTYLKERFDIFIPTKEKPTPPYYPDFIENANKYYMEKVVPHKIAVYNAGLKIMADTSVPIARMNKWQLVIHDLSKFSLQEVYYSSHNFDDFKKNSMQQMGRWRQAWVHHKHRNEHHPEHWFNVDSSGRVIPLDIPFEYVGEMVADWVGAGETYGTPVDVWMEANLRRFLFHFSTLHKVTRVASAQTGIPIDRIRNWYMMNRDQVEIEQYVKE